MRLVRGLGLTMKSLACHTEGRGWYVEGDFTLGDRKREVFSWGR